MTTSSSGLKYEPSNNQDWLREQFAQQKTIPNLEAVLPLSEAELQVQDAEIAVEKEKSGALVVPETGGGRRSLLPAITALLILVLAATLYFIWYTPFSASDSQVVSRQNLAPGSAGITASVVLQDNAQATPDTTTGDIQVYIVGAVKHPGVYRLPADARVYQLLQAAGGPLPNANLVALNLAARLTDGQEIYVATIGEKPPVIGGGGMGNAGQGHLVNINTASTDELRQQLHVSSTTAQAIVAYRTQHGPYMSVEELASVVSKTIYEKIKDKVTV
ncbi:MAG: ComEA family DNA-binding protein [Ktedonobacteraceae bacterium]|nr:ComEA family DNA-binding protein [Ktedonobacteraceae bacterium]